MDLLLLQTKKITMLCCFSCVTLYLICSVNDWKEELCSKRERNSFFYLLYFFQPIQMVRLNGWEVQLAKSTISIELFCHGVNYSIRFQYQFSVETNPIDIRKIIIETFVFIAPINSLAFNQMTHLISLFWAILHRRNQKSCIFLNQLKIGFSDWCFC